MQNIGTTLTPNVATPFMQKGAVLQVLSSGNSAGLTVQFLRGSQVQYTVTGVLTGWKLTPQGGFDGLTIESATGDTVAAIVTGGDVDVQVLDTVSQISNTAGNPVPVSVIGGIVAPNVAINNTSANAVPVSIVSEPGQPFLVQNVPASTAPADVAPVAVTAAGVALIAASASRKGLRIRNAGPGQLAITGASGTTFANAAVVLQVGDAWNEKDAPQAAWFAISDTGTTANIQTVA